MAVAALARGISLVVCVATVLLLWDRPGTSPRLGLAVGLAYLLLAGAGMAWLRRHPADRVVKRLHNVVDALAVGGVAVASGGLQSPVWLLLFPHVVAVSVRGGIAYALAVGSLDAGIVLLLARITPGLGGLPVAIALLACAAMGGATRSYLHGIQRRLAQANRELSLKNEELSRTIALSETWRREQEVAMGRLRDSEDRYRRLLGRIQDGVLIIQDARAVYVNDVFAAMAELSREELLGKDFLELVPEEDRPNLQDSYERWQQSRSVSGTLESRILTASGETMLVSLRAGSAEYEGKRAVITTIRDVTRERRLEQETQSHLAQLTEANRRLEELDRLRLQYLRNVSHEFRSPLTIIRGYVEYLQDLDSPDPEGLAEPTQIMLESCDRLIDLVDTLLEVSRIEQGSARQTLQIQQIDLEDLAEHSVDVLRPVAAKRNVTLLMEFAEAPLRLQADLGLLQQVIRKLVDNAIKYSPPGGRVVVRGEASGDEALTLEVEDGGSGIAPEHVSRIFDKFYTVDGGIDRRAGGTGVGLYLVREIVRLHDGEVNVNTRVGQGSRFLVRLPKTHEPVSTAALW